MTLRFTAKDEKNAAGPPFPAATLPVCPPSPTGNGGFYIIETEPEA
jgi:hypothetical protein